MEEKAVLRVRDRISAALTVPYVRRAVWLMALAVSFLISFGVTFALNRSEEHTSELQSRE